MGIQVKVSRGWCMFGGCLQEDAETCASDDSDVRLFEVICMVRLVMVMVWSDPAVRWWQQKIARGCQLRHQALQQPWRCLKLDWSGGFGAFGAFGVSESILLAWCLSGARTMNAPSWPLLMLLPGCWIKLMGLPHIFSFLEVPIDHICYTASALPGLLAFVSTDFNFFQSWLLPFWERRKGRQCGSCW